MARGVPTIAEKFAFWLGVARPRELSIVVNQTETLTVVEKAKMEEAWLNGYKVGYATCKEALNAAADKRYRQI